MKRRFTTTFLLLLALASFAARLSQAASYTSQFADDGETVRLRWKKGTIPIAVSASLTGANPNIKADGDGGAWAVVRRSLDAWEKAANIKFEIVPSDKQSVSPTGKFGDGVNLITVAQTPENLLLFNGAGNEDVSARTRTFYGAKGFITEADIVLNPYERFSTDGSIGTFDLEAALTHELGHLLGLEHSTVAGATMFERQGKNGTYGLPSFSARTLSEDDIAGVRALYGTKNSVADCCGAVGGRLLSANGKAAKDVQVWAEEADSERVAAAVSTNADGNFRIEGLTAGRYFIYAQHLTERKIGFTAQALGAVEVGKNKTATITKRLKVSAKTFGVDSLGFNSQISELAVPLNAGKSFVIYVGGKNLDANELTVNFNSPYFTVMPNSLSRQDFGAETSVLSFEVKVNAETPAGEYSFYLRAKNGETAYLVGGITVEDFVNPWSVFTFPTGE